MATPCPRCGTARLTAARFCSSCGLPFPEDETASDPLIGTVLPGDYVLLELVGVGGMGRVYRAEQRALGRTVAVKVIHPHLMGDEASAQRFNVEARAASRLNHPHSLAVIDFGRHGSLPYLVTEFLRGRDLARVMKEDGLLSIRRATRVLEQVLAALEEAHHAGIVHRDLKAENIVLETLRSGEDFVKVVDFGLAKLASGPGGEHRTHSSPGTIFGSPEYMAPEQARGEQVDGRADLYACGIVLFLLLTGKLPFDADTPLATLMLQLTQAAPDPLTIAPDRSIPRELGNAVLRAMAKDPADRFQSAAEFAVALRSLPTPGVVSIRSDRPCVSCRSPVPAGQRFCGSCGSPQIEDEPTEDEPIANSLRGGLPSLPLPFTMRDDTLAEIELRLLGADNTPILLRLVGDVGVGKTRLLREAAARFGDRAIVALADPDPWSADVGYWTLKHVIAELIGRPLGSGSAAFAGANGDQRAGLLDVFDLPGAARAEPTKRRYNAAVALQWAVGAAQARSGLPVLLLVDDLDHVDGATRNALEDMLFLPFTAPVLLVCAHVPRFVMKGGDEIHLQSLPARVASNLLQGHAPGRPSPSNVGRLFPPLYVEQLIRFTKEGGTNPPDKLADLVARRVDHLPVDARLVLQGMAVTGTPVSLGELERVIGAAGFDTALEALTRAGMVTLSGPAVAELRFTHPLIGEVALASAPAEVRRELHQRALDLLADLPLEARALHGYNARAGLDCLMLLEATASKAASRGDDSGEIMGLRRALDVARREMLGEDLDDAIGAAVGVGRKLGEALFRVGRLAEAEGILREALNLADPLSPARDPIEATLKQVAIRRRSS